VALVWAAGAGAGALNASEGSCAGVLAPEHGELGDCPEVLPSGLLCQPQCDDGYTVSGYTTCSEGNLSESTCVPNPCDAREEPEHGSIGDCTDTLASGEMCRPNCSTGYWLSVSSFCYLGNLTVGTCQKNAASCPDGKELKVGTCEACPASTYKEGSGLGPCQPCPLGSSTSMTGVSSSRDCICNSSMIANRTADASLSSCVPCPEHATVVGGEGQSVQDCMCVEPYILREPEDTSAELKRCRLPKPCNLAGWLSNMNFTGSEPHQLKLYTCAAFLNGTGLPSYEVCRLRCDYGSSPQLRSDFFTAVDMDVECDDGELVRHPPEGTWCSEASWDVPPIIFLAAATLAAAIAGCNLEWRQITFERRCAQALSFRLPSDARTTSGSRPYAKCKVA